MININAKFDVKAAVEQLAYAKDKQLPFATSLAINNTAKIIKDREIHEMRDVFDRPTPYVLNSIFIKTSNKQNLTATVGIKDTGRKPAAKILLAEIDGGSRRLKGYEVALRAAGALPNGYYTVPGEAATMDQYGNIAPSQLRQILSFFRANRDVGYTSNSTDKTRAKLAKGSKKRAGISYFSGSPGDGKLPPGIWMRTTSSSFTGPVKPLQPILIFVRDVNYQPIYDFDFVAKQAYEQNYNAEFEKAWEFAERASR